MQERINKITNQVTDILLADVAITPCSDAIIPTCTEFQTVFIFYFRFLLFILTLRSVSKDPNISKERRNITVGITSGSHGGEYKDGRLLGCNAVWTGVSLPSP
jgi:hypothetical protein